jgi:hypothetical protein
MGSMDVKVRCPKCHGRFYFALDEIGPNHTAACPNCETPIKVRTPEAERAPPVVATLGPAVVSVPAAAAPATAEPRPWWKFWAS